MKKTLLMAAVLAVAIVIAAGLTALPGSVQEAQANPCSTGGGVSLTPPGTPGSSGVDVDIDCDLNGKYDIKVPIP